MDGARAQQIESTVIAVASAAFAAAAGFTVWAFSHSLSTLRPIPASALAAACAILGFAVCRSILGAIDRAPAAYPLNPFDLAAIDTVPAVEVDELILTDADRLNGEPLELDDVLAELSPDSRVVRLFDPRNMPTPGELGARIDRKLGNASVLRPPVDESQDLFDALAELRRSLR